MEGVAFPDDRHFIVNPEFSTIVQLKSLDWGMERCVLNAVLPTKTKELDPAIHMNGTNVLDIWALDFDEEISFHDPRTWSKAPKRRSHFAQFVFPLSTVWSSAEFRCPSLTWNTFEFACAPMTAACQVEFWQDRASLNGIFLEQFDSVNV
ncbi:hypothetical protein EST38_g12955 [Candolleomyces aberdarensis]|uniref:Ubiquitin 3 binding protein But2 C-terminal domain-containing protein n=1 Tax=Candolleomyces aberdarensis TaxID=2316362 RepID=A0A4V1Q1V4_9AGAR|nr:hypothetical protein EST38_g12955 [Candolleomyces aberdarensis]